MNKSLKDFSLEELKKEISEREERNLQIETWKTTILKNYLLKQSPSKSEISHIFDYFQGVDKLPNLSRLSYPEAHKKSLEWTKAINLKNKNLKEAGLTHQILELENGFKFVRLVDQTSRNWEGLQMGNCVADYDVHAKLYSLRDSNEFPHITIELEVDERKIKEIKGKANTVPRSKYLPYIFKFVEYYDIILMNEDYQSLGLIRLSSEDQKYLEENFSGYIYSIYDKVLYLRHDSELVLIKPLTTINEYLFDNFVGCNICFAAQRQWIDLGAEFPHEYLNNAIYAASLEDVKFAMDKDPHVQREIEALRNYVRMLKYSNGSDENILAVKQYLKELIYKETFIGWKNLILKPYLDQIGYDKKEYRQLALFIKKEKENKQSSTFPRNEHNLKYFIHFYEFSKKYPGKEVYTIPEKGEALVCSAVSDDANSQEIASWGLPHRYDNHYAYTLYNIENNEKLGIVLGHQTDQGLVVFDHKQSAHVEMFVKSLFSLINGMKKRGLQVSLEKAGLMSLSSFHGEKPFEGIKTQSPVWVKLRSSEYFFRKCPIKFAEIPQRSLTILEIKLLAMSQSIEALSQIELSPAMNHLAIISSANLMDTKMVNWFLSRDTGYLKPFLADIIIKSTRYRQSPSAAAQLIINYAREKYDLFPNDLDWFMPSFQIKGQLVKPDLKIEPFNEEKFQEQLNKMRKR